MTLSAGTKLGFYEIVGPLGAGGMGEVYHQESTNRLFAVDVRTEPTFTFGTPVALPIERTVHPIAQRNYDVTPDGKRLLVVLSAAGADSGRRPAEQINVVLNWVEELKARVPGGK